MSFEKLDCKREVDDFGVPFHVEDPLVVGAASVLDVLGLMGHPSLLLMLLVAGELYLVVEWDGVAGVSATLQVIYH